MGMICLDTLSFTYGVEVFLRATGEDELHIGLRFVIDQKVQFAAIKPCFGKLVLHCDAVDGEAATVGEHVLYTVGIEINATSTKIQGQSSV